MIFSDIKDHTSHAALEYDDLSIFHMGQAFYPRYAVTAVNDVAGLIALSRKGMGISDVLYYGDNVSAAGAQHHLPVCRQPYFFGSALEAPVILILAHVKDEATKHLRIIYEFKLYIIFIRIILCGNKFPELRCLGGSRRHDKSELCLQYFLTHLSLPVSRPVACDRNLSYRSLFASSVIACPARRAATSNTTSSTCLSLSSSARFLI